jgi:hypothetical protein
MQVSVLEELSASYFTVYLTICSSETFVTRLCIITVWTLTAVNTWNHIFLFGISVVRGVQCNWLVYRKAFYFNLLYVRCLIEAWNYFLECFLFSFPNLLTYQVVCQEEVWNTWNNLFFSVINIMTHRFPCSYSQLVTYFTVWYVSVLP